jgi:hypothetical protein
VRVRTHASLALGCECLQLRDEPPVVIEQPLGLIAAQPAFEQLQVGRIVVHACERYLVGTPEAFHLVAVHVLRTGPALGRAQNDHRPVGATGNAARARLLLDPANLQHAVFQRRGHFLVHLLRVVAFHEIRRPAVAPEQIPELRLRNASEQCRVVNLVAVEVKDRQNCAITNGVQELAGVP